MITCTEHSLSLVTGLPICVSICLFTSILLPLFLCCDCKFFCCLLFFIGSQRQKKPALHLPTHFAAASKGLLGVCVCVCLCVWQKTELFCQPVAAFQTGVLPSYFLSGK